MSTFVLGFVTGVPLMLAVGPIAVLLLEIGMGRGWRRGWWAALGVAAADLTFAGIAARCGVAVAHTVRSYDGVVRAVGAVALGLVALHLAVSARRTGTDGSAAVLSSVPAARPVPVASPSGGTGGGVATAVVLPDLRLVPRFYALTIVNPLTIAAFGSVVLAAGSRGGGWGWVAGMGAASLCVHSAFVGAGAAVGATLGPRVSGALRWVGAGAVAAVAVAFVA